MSEKEFLHNKIEEALQLLAAHNELVEKQTEMIEELLARMANMQAEQYLASYLKDHEQGKTIAA